MTKYYLPSECKFCKSKNIDGLYVGVLSGDGNVHTSTEDKPLVICFDCGRVTRGDQEKIGSWVWSKKCS